VQQSIVAAAYGFVERGEFFLFQQGWDPAYARLSLGNLGIGWSLELCMRLGIRFYDMLPGDYRYKAEWCPDRRELVGIQAFARTSVLAAGYRLLRKARHEEPAVLSPA
jgi:CelD/BcsL family acetyltransferase involved in cellulose biosynthesis